MKVFSTTHDFAYSWAEVSTANWRKYCPWNKESTHVIAVDTLSRSFDPTTNLLRTERLITCKQTTPKWIASILGGADTSHVYEISYVTPPSADVEAVKEREMDRLPGVGEGMGQGNEVIRVPSARALPSPPSHEGPRNPSVTMVSYNLTWADLLSVRETVTYTPSPLDPKTMTRFEQNVSPITLFLFKKQSKIRQDGNGENSKMTEY